MCGIILDALILMGVLSAMEGEDVGFGSAVLVSLVVSILTGLISIGLQMVIGIAGVFIASAIGMVGVGIGVSAAFGVEIKRAMLIGVIYAVARIAVYLFLLLMFSLGTA